MDKPLQLELTWEQMAVLRELLWAIPQSETKGWDGHDWRIFWNMQSRIDIALQRAK